VSFAIANFLPCGTTLVSSTMTTVMHFRVLLFCCISLGSGVIISLYAVSTKVYFLLYPDASVEEEDFY